MRGDIILSQEEAHRAKVFGEVSKGSMTLREAAVVLRISYRHTRRVYRRFREQGVAGLAHRRRGRPASNAIDPDLRTRILQFVMGQESIKDAVVFPMDRTRFGGLSQMVTV